MARVFVHLNLIVEREVEDEGTLAELEKRAEKLMETIKPSIPGWVTNDYEMSVQSVDHDWPDLHG